MVRRVLSVLAVALVGLLAFGGLSNAQSARAAAYPPPPVTVIVNVNITIIIINNGVIFFGSGFNPLENIAITVSYGPPSGLRGSHSLTQMAAAKDQTTQADSAGGFSTVVELTQTGTATLTATGLTSGNSATQTVQVLGVGAKVPAGTTGSSNTAASGAVGSSSTGSSSSTGLANTGASIAGPIAIGAVALFAGLALLFFGTRGVARRRGSRPTDST